MGAKKSETSYFGKAGHLYVMSEFLRREYNVAIPEVDTGDDIFVVHDEDQLLHRIQVKSAKGTSHPSFSHQAKYTIRHDQVTLDSATPYYFAFVCLWDDRWDSVVLIEKKDFQRFYFAKGMDRKARNTKKFSIVLYYSRADVTWGTGKEAPRLSAFLDNWTPFTRQIKR